MRHAARPTGRRVGLLLPLLAVLEAAGGAATLSAARTTPSGPEIGPPSEAAEGTASDTLGESSATVHLLRRATFGVRPEDVREARAMGREAWLERQLHPEAIPDPGLTGRLARFPAASLPTAELFARYPTRAALRARLEEDDRFEASEERSTGERRERLRDLHRAMGTQPAARILIDLVGSKLQRAAHSERQLEEVMTDFWFNHFNVFWGKGPDRWLVADFERTAIRPHVFGSFEQMLVATARHPAMLVYLDNWRSGRGQGVNENYARELLELHTLGVDGGYSQEDVEEVARVFTGWSLARTGPSGTRRRPEGRGGAATVQGVEFRFRPRMHDPGNKRVLGRAIAGGRGEVEGLELLRMLAAHPATARHLATKLARAFVADEPPASVIDELAETFLATRGDLREVTRSLFSSGTFYDPAHRGAKLKSPFELVVSALRISRAEVAPSPALLEQLRALGQLPYLNPVPTGYPEAAEAWASGGAMLQRMSFALALAAERLPGVSVPAPPAEPEALLAAVLPGSATAGLLRTIRADLEESGVEGETAARRALGLALGSPEFQRH